jgi:hypothetical protein
MLDVLHKLWLGKEMSFASRYIFNSEKPQLNAWVGVIMMAYIVLLIYIII